MDNLETTCCKIISTVGIARSMYIESIELAKEQKFDDAYKIIEQADSLFLKGHKYHSELLRLEASGEQIKTGLLLMHSEDQLMSAESFKILSSQLIEMYKVIHTNGLQAS